MPMMKDLYILLTLSRQKVLDTLKLLSASKDTILPFNENETYTPKELEPYDALCDRFIRCIELSLKFMKIYEKYNYSIESITTRDLLNIIEKNKLITNTEIWLNMRDIRNRIVHDYLPQQTKLIYEEIIENYYEELMYFKMQIENIQKT